MRASGKELWEVAIIYRYLNGRISGTFFIRTPEVNIAYAVEHARYVLEQSTEHYPESVITAVKHFGTLAA